MITVLAVEDMRNLLVETLNSRDPALLDRAGVPNAGEIRETVQTMNERWPRMMLTRGDVDGTPVGVVWAPDQAERYRQVAHVEITDDGEGFDLSFVDGVDPALTAEDPPGRTVAEWESASQLDRGEGRWV